jgi:hypothetical protein
MRHEFGGAGLEAYGMGMADEILFLPALGIVAEMAIDTVPDIIGLAHINDLPFFIMEIIYPGSIRELFKMLFRHIGR